MKAYETIVLKDNNPKSLYRKLNNSDLENVGVIRNFVGKRKSRTGRAETAQTGIRWVFMGIHFDLLVAVDNYHIPMQVVSGIHVPKGKTIQEVTMDLANHPYIPPTGVGIEENEPRTYILLAETTRRIDELLKEREADFLVTATREMAHGITRAVGGWVPKTGGTFPESWDAREYETPPSTDEDKAFENLATLITNGMLGGK